MAELRLSRVAKPASLPAGPTLRGAVLVAAMAGQVSTAAGGALPWSILPVTLVLLVAVTEVAARVSAGLMLNLRRFATLAAAFGLVLLLRELSGLSDPEQARRLFGLMLVGASVCQGLTWQSVRDLRSGLVAALGMLVLGGSYAPDVLIGLPLLVGWVAVLVAMMELPLSERVPAGLVAITGNPRRARAYAGPIALALVLGLVAFLLVPVPVANNLRNRLAGAGGPPILSDRQAGGAGAFSGDRLDLRVRGALGTQRVAVVPADSPSLWRSTTYDGYDGTSWTRPEQGALNSPSYAEVGPARQERLDEVKLLVDTQGAVFSPGPVTALRTPPETQVTGTALGDIEARPLSSYAVASLEPITDASTLRDSRGPDILERRWREVPAALPGRVGSLAAEITAGANGRYESALLIEQWLKNNATYRLDSPVPVRGEDAVDRFLFVDRSGFCEQFASAEVILLRTLGIPARLVTGLAYGERDGKARLYRSSHLHAWVELWVPGVGWVTSDPTRGALRAAAAAPSVRSRAAAAVTSALRSLLKIPGGKPALAAGLLLLTACVALFLARRPRRRRTAKAVEPVAAGNTALAAFLRLDARLGERRRRRAESLREMRARLQPGPELGTAFEVVEQECYAPVVPAGVGEAIAVLDGAER